MQTKEDKDYILANQRRQRLHIHRFHIHTGTQVSKRILLCSLDPALFQISGLMACNPPLRYVIACIACIIPKIHKSSIPLKPILSCINNYSYKIAKFFIPILSYSCSSAFMVRDSFFFVQELLSLDFNSNNLAMASFDVTSLFTNIPLDEAIEIIADRLFSNAIRFHDLTRSEFKQLLNCAVKNCHSLFNGSLY